MKSVLYALGVLAAVALARPAAAESTPRERGAQDLALERTTRELIHQVGPLDGGRFDPVALVRATNSLLLLGPRDAGILLRRLADEAERADDVEEFADHNRLFLVLLLYFQFPPDKKIPLGSACMMPPHGEQYQRGVPSFPILIVDDFPILLNAAMTVPSVPLSMKRFVRWCELNGTPRQTLLSPTVAPLKLLERVERTGVWVFDGAHSAAERTRGRKLIAAQTVRAIQPAVLLNEKRALWSMDREWDTLVEEASQTRLRWDARRNRYERANF